MPILPRFPRHHQDQQPRGVGVPLALRPSLSSRVARSFFASTSKSRVRDMSPILIDDRIFEWWDGQDHTTIHKLELRKERDRFKHEFVMIYLDNVDRWIHRVERRPLGGPTTDAMFAKGCDAEDSITPVNGEELEIIQRDTDCKIEVEFHSNPKPDVYAILAVCDAIRKDPHTKRYTLQQFNCYFVARAIMVFAIRHYLLHHSAPFQDLRWYALTESAASKYLSQGNWDALDKGMKEAVITVLAEALWPIVQTDAEPLVKERRHLKRLETNVKSVIQTMVQQGHRNLVDESLKRCLFQWVSKATQGTLWYDNLEHNLLNQEQKGSYEQSAGLTLRRTMKPDLEERLPGSIGVKLPKRLLHRLPHSLLASLPPELMARFPSRFLDKLPDEIVQNISDTHMERAPDEYLAALSTPLFERTPTRVVLRLPDDLHRVPARLLDVSLRRIRAVLEDPIPSEECYRPLALKLLKRLPEDLLDRLPPNYSDIQGRTTVDEIEPTQVVSVIGTQSISTVTRPAKLSPLDYFIRWVPRGIHKRTPAIMAEMFPMSWYRNLSAEAVAWLPPESIAKLRPRLLAKLPRELLERIPESTLMSLPRETLERVPDELLERLPVQLLKNIPNELLSNLPENVTDLLREAIATNIFERDDLREKLGNNAGSVVMDALKNPSKLSRSIIRISFEDPSDKKMKNSETLEAFQQFILDMNREHSRTIAKFGADEEEVYQNLRQKKEDMWRSAYPRSFSPGSAVGQ